MTLSNYFSLCAISFYLPVTQETPSSLISYFVLVLDLFFSYFNETLYLPGKMTDCILLNIRPEVAI